jgi:hypothetical protein
MLLTYYQYEMNKKSIITIILLVLLAGCSKEHNLLKQAEKYLITQMNDPKSYTRERYQIKDTVTMLEYEKIVNENLISDIKKEEPNLYSNLSISEFNLNHVRSTGNVDSYWETKSYNDIKRKINIIGVLVDSLHKRNNYLSRIKDTTGVKYIDVLIRYRGKNVYGGTVRVLCTIRCTPEERNQKITWTFKTIDVEPIANN